MATQKVGSLLIDVAANVAGVKRDLDQVTSEINRFSRSIDSTFKALGKTIGVGLSFAGVVASVKSWVSAAAEAETASAKLGTALRAHGVESRAALDAYKSISSSLQSVTQYSDEAIQSVMRFLTSMGVGPAQIQPATEAALRLASAFDLDLNTAAMKVAQAMEGNYKGLKQIIPALREVKSGSLDASQVLQLIEETVGKGAFALDTYDKKVAAFKNSWNDVTETLGNLFLPVAKDVLDVLTRITHAMLEQSQGNEISWLEKELKFAEKRRDEFKKLLADLPSPELGVREALEAEERHIAEVQRRLRGLLWERDEILKGSQETFKKATIETTEHTKKQVDELDKEFQRTVKGWEHLAQAWKGYLDPREMQADLQYVYRAQKAMYGDSDKFVQKWETDIDQARGKLKTLADSGTSDFKRLEDAITMVGSKFADTIADMVLGAEVSFKDMIDSMIHDLVRFQIQAQMNMVIPAIASGIGGMFGGGGTVPAYSPERQPGALTMGSAYGGVAAGAAAGAGGINPYVTGALIALAMIESETGGGVSKWGGSLMENKYLATIFPFFNPQQTYKSWKELITSPKSFFGQGADEKSKVAFGFNLPGAATGWEQAGALGTIGLTKEKGVSGQDIQDSIKSWIQFDNELAKLLSEEQISKIKAMAGWRTATYHDFEAKDVEDAMIDRFRRMGQELGEDFVGELMASFKGKAADLPEFLERMELIDKIRDAFAKAGLEDVFVDWEDFTDTGIAALDELVATWAERMERVTEGVAGTFAAGMQAALEDSGGFASFEKAVKQSIMTSITAGLIEGFAQTAMVQKALAPFFATMDQAFSDAFAGGDFNKAVWDALMGPAFAGLAGNISSMQPVFDALTEVIGKLNEAITGVPSYQSGTEYVPKTGIYRLHQGEEVVGAGKSKTAPIQIGSLMTVHGSLIADRGELDRFVIRLKGLLDDVQRINRYGAQYTERRTIDAGVLQ